MKNLHEPLLLPADVLILSRAEIDPAMLNRLDWTEGDSIITCPTARVSSRKIDGDTARLLLHFRDPRTILEAVFRHSVLNQRDAQLVLSAVFPILQKLVQDQLLVPANSVSSDHFGPAYAPGISIAGFVIIKCVQSLRDTEVYHVCAPDGLASALKIAGPQARAVNFDAMDREETVLRRLNGRHSVRLRQAGYYDGKKYLVTEWCEGRSAARAAETLRKPWLKAGHPALGRLCCSIANAYCGLHDLGVIHSDVHPRNIIVASEGEVNIIDFGLSHLDEGDHKLTPPDRGGVGFYFEPEYVRAHRLREAAPVATRLGEQYQVGALLYSLLTGAYYLNFSLDQSMAYRQIEEEAPLSFASRGAMPWPRLEQVLNKALNKRPETRYASMTEFTQALTAAAADDAAWAEAHFGKLTTTSPKNQNAKDFVEATIGRYRIVGDGLLSRAAAPTCSINYGAAGIAYMFYHLACRRSSAALLSQADLWSTWADRYSSESTAFNCPRLQLTPGTIGTVSLYHTVSGVRCVQGLVNQAMGNLGALHSAINDFIAASSAACENLDVTLGCGSTLLGCALLHDLDLEEARSNRPQLVQFGNALMERISSAVQGFAPISTCRKVEWLGMAHGWAGVLYGIMRWCDKSKIPAPIWLHSRLNELAALAETKGKGLSWRRQPIAMPGSEEPWTGWCHGSAGYVYLWSLAHRMFKETRFRDLALGAAWHVWESSRRNNGNLCCGAAGEGYALLHAFKCSGEPEWVDRARETGLYALETGVSHTLMPGSLYKGDVGVALLLADLEEPDGAAMPMFE